MIKYIKFEYRITFAYLLIGGGWILFSDKALHFLVINNELSRELQTYKGWFYVLITALLFFLFLKKHLNKLRYTENELEKHKNNLQQLVNLKTKDLTHNQQKLAKLTDRFTISLEAAKIGVWDFDIMKNILVWDKMMYRLYGISEDTYSLAYEAWQAGLHPDDIERAEKELTLAQSGEKSFDTEFRVIWPDKSIHHIRALAKVERDEAGNPIRMIGANWDITDVKESENLKIHAKGLETKNKELEQFAYVASHDLQEPLNTVSSFVNLLLLKYRDKLDEEGIRILAYISGASERMKALVSGLLDYSRIGRNLQLARVDCQAIVDQVLEDFSLLIEESKTNIEVTNLPELNGYETELRMVFQNLISNAIKFRKADEGLKIKISAIKQLNHYWLFTVEDNGIGIEEQYKDRIFLIFQRLHTRSEYEGTGIGLAHCKKIVEMHQGEIWMKSTVNQGTTFFFTIPLLKK